MRETTLLEVMAEVSREASTVLPMGRVHDMLVQADAHLDGAFRGRGDRRRESLKMAAAVLIRALHAHDAEAAKVDDRPLHSRALGGPISADDAAIAKKARIPCVRTPWMLEHVTCPTCGAPPGKSCAHAESEAK